jgi:hypothetical protein
LIKLGKANRLIHGNYFTSLHTMGAPVPICWHINFV